MGNQPWPQFQNGIRERSIVKLLDAYIAFCKVVFYTPLLYLFFVVANKYLPWIRGSKERSRSSQNSRPQDERAKRAKGEEPLVTLDHNLVLEPVRLHVKLLCQDKRAAQFDYKNVSCALRRKPGGKDK